MQTLYEAATSVLQDVSEPCSEVKLEQYPTHLQGNRKLRHKSSLYPLSSHFSNYEVSGLEPYNDLQLLG